VKPQGSSIPSIRVIPTATSGSAPQRDSVDSPQMLEQFQTITERINVLEAKVDKVIEMILSVIKTSEKSESAPDEWMTQEEVGKLAGCRRQTVSARMNEGVLPFYRFGGRGKRKLKKKDVLDAIKKGVFKYPKVQ
jgi:excisionase family DNA binding protein